MNILFTESLVSCVLYNCSYFFKRIFYRLLEPVHFSLIVHQQFDGHTIYVLFLKCYSLNT